MSELYSSLIGSLIGVFIVLAIVAINDIYCIATTDGTNIFSVFKKAAGKKRGTPFTGRLSTMNGVTSAAYNQINNGTTPDQELLAEIKDLKERVRLLENSLSEHLLLGDHSK